jgi:hypothetical protein
MAPVAPDYESRAAEQYAARDRWAAVSRRISYARLAVFIGAAVGIIAAISGEFGFRLAFLAAGILLVVVFAALVVWHDRVERRERWHDALGHVAERGAARIRRDWRVLPVPSADADPDHAYAVDLDLFGRASLFQLLNPATGSGASTLRAWLLAPADPETIGHRQAAVAALASDTRFREAFAAHGYLAKDDEESARRLVEWARGENWLRHRPWLVWGARIVTASVALTIALDLAGVLEGSPWVLPLAIGQLLFAATVKRSGAALDRAASPEHTLGGYADLLELASRIDGQAPMLAGLREGLVASGTAAHLEMRRLSRILASGNLRHAAAMLWLPVNALTLWDLHVWAALEAWRARCGPSVEAWLRTLGELDALSSLSALVHDEPGWSFPEIAGRGGAVFDAAALAHPLLPADRRVANDVRVGPPGTFLLVTGSNMSGKSTLLRSIGVNAVLALAGGPVTAARLTLPPVQVFTSMRVLDSVTEGVSYFMAALNRLKLIVDASDRATGDRLLLYLLDEILQGTNTAERQIGVRRVLRHLLAQPAIGAVTTHDLGLADAPDLEAASVRVHFEERVRETGEGAAMTFDYVLRTGIATSTNALMLMKLIGLDP